MEELAAYGVLPRLGGAAEEVTTVRPLFTSLPNAWASIEAEGPTKAEQMAQTAVDPGEAPSTAKGIKDSTSGHAQVLLFKKLVLPNGAKVKTVTFHLWGKVWTAKLKVNVNISLGNGLAKKEGFVEKANEASAGGASAWAKTGWGTEWPWKPFPEAELLSHIEGGAGAESYIELQATFTNGKASLQELNEVYAVVTWEAVGEHAERSVGDTFTVSESVSRAVAFPRALGDSFTISESAERLTSAPRAVGDSFAASDSAARTTAASRTAGDAFTVSDGASGPRRLPRSVGDTFTVSDSVAYVKSKLVTVGDTFTVSESAVSGPAARSRTAGDTFAVATSVSFQRGGAMLEAVIKVTSRKNAVITPTSRRQVVITISSRRQVDIKIGEVR